MTTKTVEAQFKEILQTLNTFEDENFSPLKTAEYYSHAYYRSKLFAVHNHQNNIFNAAAPILNVATTLKNLKNPPSINQLRHDLIHEIKAFENKLRGNNYQHSVILAARYILCAFIDEIVVNTSWGKKSDWQLQNLVSLFQSDFQNEDKFFVILERCCLEPKIHIDLLELIYICLCLGHQGKFYYQTNAYEELTEIIDQLYELILQERGEYQPTSYLASEPIFEDKNFFEKMPAWSIFLTTFLLLIGVHSGFNFLISEKSIPLYQDLNTLVNTTE